MLYWWVNNGLTFKEEIDGGYIWSPKENANGGFNFSYTNMQYTAEGHIIFSYAQTAIQGIGVVTGDYIEAPKPEAFGDKGENWNQSGWKVPVKWTRLPLPVRSKEFIAAHSHLVAEKYSPFQTNGNGNQGCYLGKVRNELGQKLLKLCNSPLLPPKVVDVIAGTPINGGYIPPGYDFDEDTSREQLTFARIGQARFRKGLVDMNEGCLVTGETNPKLLRASHIKPWSKSDNRERIDSYNGFLLAPHVDMLFDRGWISFADDGTLLIANNDTKETLLRWHVDLDTNIGPITPERKKYLAYHRANVFQKKRLLL